MKLTPVLNFSGDCEEAIHLYESAFGTKVDFILRYVDANLDDWNRPLSEEQAQFVYHSEMTIGNQHVMFSDIIEFDVVKGTSNFLAIIFETKTELLKVYEKLSVDSTIINPMKSTSYSSCFVNFVDKFGVRWAMMTENTE
jgi:PhnB protein